MLITLPPTCNKDKTKVKSGEEEKKLEKKQITKRLPTNNHLIMIANFFFFLHR